MKKSIFTLILISSIGRATSSDLAFVDTSFDSFVTRVVTNTTDQKYFKIYYERLSEKLAHIDQDQRTAARKYLHQTALENLEKKHAAWYQEIQSFCSDVSCSLDEQQDGLREQVRQFLSWYGAYEEYLSAKKTPAPVSPSVDALALSEQSRTSRWWSRFKTFAADTKKKVAGVFKRKQEHQHHIA